MSAGKPTKRENRSAFENRNVDTLVAQGWDVGLLRTTKTTRDKGISDATEPFREFLVRNQIFDYASHQSEAEHHPLPTIFVGSDDATHKVTASLYLTTKGDRRIGFTAELKNHFDINELLACVWSGGQLWVFNATRMALHQSATLKGFSQDGAEVGPLRGYILKLAKHYDPNITDVEGNDLPALAPDILEPLIPAGLRVIVPSANGTPAAAPWIGILDPDEASTTNDGLFLAWVFKQSTREAILTLAQGMSLVGRAVDPGPMPKGMSPAAALILRGLAADASGLQTSSDLGNELHQAGFMAANILAKTYSVSDMPPEVDLRLDLQRFCQLYQSAVLIKNSALAVADGSQRFRQPAPEQHAETLLEFKPKDRRDYVVHIESRIERRRADRHEYLLTQYGTYAGARGFEVANVGVHPRDLILARGLEQWLVEAKVVYNGDARQAVRAAIGQLLEYSHFLYDADAKPRMMALFTEPIGKAFVGLLDRLGIAVVWKGLDRWEGSEEARMAGLV
jgi:hypothetical protein